MPMHSCYIQPRREYIKMLSCPEWLQMILLSTLCVTTFGGCLFPQLWSGRWFLYGEGYVTVNSTSFGRKGECEQNDVDKYVVFDRRQRDSCRTCLAVYMRHENVIQYKESNCLVTEPLEELCQEIKGDEPLLTMFRVDDTVPIPCPFESPPYRFSYNRGTLATDCQNPPSHIDSCTDSSKMLVTFAACPDIEGTESGVEEWNCLATWKEGSYQYMIGKIKKIGLMVVEEDRYRCFIYNRQSDKYQLSQSADATCSSVASPTEGSMTMHLTKVDNVEEHCKFPNWVVGSHYHWHSQENSHVYHFTHKNGTLRVTRNHGLTDMRFICHHIVTNYATTITIVAHATHACTNGYVCMSFKKRGNSVIQLQQSDEMVVEPSEACDRSLSGPVTLVSAGSQDGKCPELGRFVTSEALDWTTGSQSCDTNTTLHIGCSDSHGFISLLTCDQQSHSSIYSCHASWSENQTTYMVVSPVNRKSADVKRFCLILIPVNGHVIHHLYLLSDSCTLSSNQLVLPYTLTLQGSCLIEHSTKDSSGMVIPSLMTIVFAMVGFLR